MCRNFFFKRFQYTSHGQDTLEYKIIYKYKLSMNYLSFIKLQYKKTVHYGCNFVHYIVSKLLSFGNYEHDVRDISSIFILLKLSSWFSNSLEKFEIKVRCWQQNKIVFFSESVLREHFYETKDKRLQILKLFNAFSTKIWLLETVPK